MGHEVLQQRHELRHDRYHAGHRTAATEDVATLLDVGTAVYGEGHSRPAQPHSRPSTAAGENAPRQDIPLDCGTVLRAPSCWAARRAPEDHGREALQARQG